MEELVKKQKELITVLQRTVELDNELLGGYKKIVSIQKKQLEKVGKMVPSIIEKIEAAEKQRKVK